MGNAHAVAAKRFPGAVSVPQNPSHIRTAVGNGGNASIPGLIGVGIFGSGIHQAAVAARAAVGAVNAVIDSTLYLDHEDGIRVEVQAIESNSNSSESVIRSQQVVIHPEDGYKLFGSVSNNVSTLFSDSVWLPRIVRQPAITDDLHFTEPAIRTVAKSDHMTAVFSSLGLTAITGELSRSSGKAGRCAEAVAALTVKKLKRQPVQKIVEQNPYKGLDPMLREQRFAVDDTVEAFVSPVSASAESSTSLSHIVPGLGIIVFVGALIYSVVPIHHAELMQELLFSNIS